MQRKSACYSTLLLVRNSILSNGLVNRRSVEVGNPLVGTSDFGPVVDPLASSSFCGSVFFSVTTLPDLRRLKLLVGTAGFGSAFSSLSDLLELSPLVGTAGFGINILGLGLCNTGSFLSFNPGLSSLFFFCVRVDFATRKALFLFVLNTVLLNLCMLLVALKYA